VMGDNTAISDLVALNLHDLVVILARKWLMGRSPIWEILRRKYSIGLGLEARAITHEPQVGMDLVMALGDFLRQSLRFRDSGVGTRKQLVGVVRLLGSSDILRARRALGPRRWRSKQPRLFAPPLCGEVLELGEDLLDGVQVR